MPDSMPFSEILDEDTALEAAMPSPNMLCTISPPLMARIERRVSLNYCLSVPIQSGEKGTPEKSSQEGNLHHE